MGMCPKALQAGSEVEALNVPIMLGRATCVPRFIRQTELLKEAKDSPIVYSKFHHKVRCVALSFATYFTLEKHC